MGGFLSSFVLFPSRYFGTEEAKLYTMVPIVVSHIHTKIG
jgi:hypothetical protein